MDGAAMLQEDAARKEALYGTPGSADSADLPAENGRHLGFRSDHGCAPGTCQHHHDDISPLKKQAMQ